MGAENHSRPMSMSLDHGRMSSRAADAVRRTSCLRSAEQRAGGAGVDVSKRLASGAQRGKGMARSSLSARGRAPDWFRPLLLASTRQRSARPVRNVCGFASLTPPRRSSSQGVADRKGKVATADLAAEHSEAEIGYALAPGAGSSPRGIPQGSEESKIISTERLRAAGRRLGGARLIDSPRAFVHRPADVHLTSPAPAGASGIGRCRRPRRRRCLPACRWRRPARPCRRPPGRGR